MTSEEYKYNVIARRAIKIRKTAKEDIKFIGLYRNPFKVEKRYVLRLYFEPGTLLDSRRLEKWRKRLLADYYTVVIEKGLKKVSFYCRLDNFWWKFIKCSFC